jgi:hypothetical protein
MLFYDTYNNGGLKMSTKSDASNRYTSRNYDRINIIVKKGMRDHIKEYATAKGMSINRLINRALADTVPGFEMIDGIPIDKRGPETLTGTAPVDQERSDGNDGTEKKPF